MTTLTDTQVITASGGLVELGYSQITSTVTPTSTTGGSGTDVLGPLTFVSDGSPVLVEFYSYGVQPKPNANSAIVISLYEDGVEKMREFGTFFTPAAGTFVTPAHLKYRYTPTSGAHTVQIKAFCSAGAGTPYIYGGTGGTGGGPTFLRVSKIVQATQWPAVTTGTIICTSSTRPASPFEGQRIYQTDDKRELVYNGSAWVTTTAVSAYVATSQTTTNTSFTDLSTAGPSVTVQTGARALVTVGGAITAPTTSHYGVMSFAVSGATTRSASDVEGAFFQSASGGQQANFTRTIEVTNLTAGSNTFTAKYRVTTGTGTFEARTISVVGIP